MQRVSDAETGHRLDERAAALAVRQHGVLSREQLLAIGFSRGQIQARVKAGRWSSPWRDVFVVGGAPASWRQELLVACIAWGSGAAVSHLAAPPLLGLVGLKPGSLHLTIPRRRKRVGPGVVHRNFLPQVDVTVVDAIPVTTVARTLIDIAPFVQEATLEAALDDALHQGLVSVRRLRWRLDELGRRPGVGILREVLDARGRWVPHSVLETAFVRLVRMALLPEPVLQFVIRDAGRPVGRVDAAYPEQRIAIELDGRRYHAGRQRWQHDMSRGTAIAALGWRLLRFSWEDIERRPGFVVDAVRAALSPA